MPDLKEKLVELLSHSPSLDALYGYPSFVESAEWLIAHGVTVQEWISVKERLPDMYQNVLAIRADGKIVVDAIGSLEIWYKQMDLVGRPVTHWMPLPTAPKEDK